MSQGTKSGQFGRWFGSDACVVVGEKLTLRNLSVGGSFKPPAYSSLSRLLNLSTCQGLAHNA